MAKILSYDSCTTVVITIVLEYIPDDYLKEEVQEDIRSRLVQISGADDGDLYVDSVSGMISMNLFDVKKIVSKSDFVEAMIRARKKLR